MTQVHSKFSSGQEVANMVVTSGVLGVLCNKISQHEGAVGQNEPLTWKDYEESDPVTITFVTSRTVSEQLLEERALDSSSSLRHFPFLCTKAVTSFGLHKAAMTLFDSFVNQLSQLKEKYGDLSRPLIISGHSLGGSIAVLFTLWLLKDINEPGTKRHRPLCITFGAPLIGNEPFQKAMSNYPIAHSCFLHVAAKLDSVPRLFLSRSVPQDPNAMDVESQTGTGAYYKPFGTFLLCSKAGCTCVEDPGEVSVLLEAMGSASTVGHGNQWQMKDYEGLAKHLMSSVLIKGTSQFGELIEEPLRAGIVLELEAIGVERTQPNDDKNQLIAELVEMEESWLNKKMITYDPSRKLNESKINMVQLEWYKKSCKRVEIGYYDCYKSRNLQPDMKVTTFKKFLNKYWEEKVADAEKNPQTNDSAFRIRYLYGGNNYRRMVEPLDIAEFYRKEGARDYKKNGRSHHYKQLEDWLYKDSVKDLQPTSSNINAKKAKVADILTEDSCFWAHVEEALIDCKSIKNGEDIDSAARNRLKDFEEYVMKEIRNFAVSSEVFLAGSTFMKWWSVYEGIIEGTPDSGSLAHFMMNKLHKRYEKGAY